MIAGTFVVKKHTIQFWVLLNGRVEYLVENFIEGTSAMKEVDMSIFAAAMHVALAGRECVDERTRELAEEAMPLDYNVRLRAETGAKEVAAVRWID